MVDKIGLDEILIHVGCFGKYQLTTFFLIFLVTIFNCACHMAYVFTAMEPENRCFIPGCDGKKATFMADYVKIAIPIDTLGRPRKCEIYDFKNNSHISTCSDEQFDKEKINFCSAFIFLNRHNSIANEYNLLCEDDAWKLSLVSSLNTFGMFLGMGIAGHLSDRYGRKMVLLFGMTLGGLVGLSKALSSSLIIFGLLEFFEAFIEAGCHDSIFILAMEMVTPQYRFWISCVFFTTCSSGQMVLAVVAWMVRDWRLIIYVLYAPSISFIFLYPFILESTRWQLSKGKLQRAKDSLNKIAKSNGKCIQPSYFYTLQKNLIEKEDNSKKISLTQLVKSKVLLMRLITCTFLWMTCAFIFYGLTLSSVSLSGNDYLNFLLVSLIEIPAYWLMPLVGSKLNRKLLLIGSYFLTSISCALLIFFDGKGEAWLLLIIHCLAKFGASFAFNVLYIITSELFPTAFRQTTMGFCSMVGRIGSMISPQISLMDVFWSPLPNMIFASAAGSAGLLTFILPETLNVKLPDTIQEAENIGNLEVQVAKKHGRLSSEVCI